MPTTIKSTETPELELVSVAEDATVVTDEQNVISAEELDAAGDSPVVETQVAGKSKGELVDMLAEVLESNSAEDVRSQVEQIKTAFYKIHRAQVDARLKEAAESGVEAEQVQDSDELRLKELLKKYRDARDKATAESDKVKEENYRLKCEIIEELKSLISSEETLNVTFARFRELQARWKEIGQVPQAKVNDLWETYNLHVERFYDFVKINKELRDLDLKKNLEAKGALCEAAEALAEQSNIVEAFRKLQKLHDQWRETGPVAAEQKEALWERFKAASSVVNRRHQEHFESLKQEQLKNLEAKTALCEAAEALIATVPASHKEWNKANERLIELQGQWRTIGFAPKKENAKIYDRFRAACDKFFERKSAHFATVEGGYADNLQKKQALIAEMNAADVKAGGYDMIKEYQRRWSEIGFVPIKHKEEIAKLYKQAVDRMFAVVRGADRENSLSRFKDKVNSMRQGGERRLRSEREKLYNRVRQLEQEVATLENNIGFFSKSKGAESFIAEVEEKIAKAKRDIADTIAKIKLIDDGE